MNSAFAIFDSMSVAWATWMISMSWQAAVLFAVLAVVGFCLRQRSARFRYYLWTLMPLRLLLPPSLALVTGWAWWVLPDQPAETKPTAEVPAVIALHEPIEQINEPIQVANRQVPGLPLVDADLQMPAEQHSTRPSVSVEAVPIKAVPIEATAPVQINDTPNIPYHQWLRNIAFGVWLIVATLLTGRLLLGYRNVRRWVADSLPAEETTQAILLESCRLLGMSPRVRVRVSDAVWTPLVTGLFRPVILLPPVVLTSLNPRELQAVLIHELQHVKRRDFFQECLLLLVQILYFFHPCVWLANRQLRRLREQACDEATIAALNGQRQEYGSGFVKVAELMTKPAPRLTFGVADSGEPATSRLRRILDPKLRIGRGISWSGLALIVVLGLVLIPSSARRQTLAETPTEAGKEEATKKAEQPTKETNQPAADSKAWDDAPIIGHDDVDPVLVNGLALDTAGKPAANCNVVLKQFYFGKFTEATGITNAQGRFRVRLFRDQPHESIELTASNTDQSQLVYYFFEPQIASYPKLFQLQLSPKREVQVKVLDKYGYPVVKAHAGIILVDANSSQTFFIETSTDALGIARWLLPTNCGISRVAAWKDHEGFDFRFNKPSRDDKTGTKQWLEYPASGSETLQLEGVLPVTVKVVDADGAPLPGIGVRPGPLYKGAEYFWSDLPFDQSREQKTDAQGETTFNWIPRWQTKQLEFRTRSPAYEEGTATYDMVSALSFRSKKPEPPKIVLTKLVPVRGYVRDKNGAAVAHAAIRAYGQAYSGKIREESDTTVIANHDGAYELLVPPDKHYLVIATARGMSATPQTGFAVHKNQPVENKDFTLRQATRIHGKMVDEENQPIQNVMFWFWQVGQSTLEDPRTKPHYHNFYQTDEQGNFGFQVGDGDFIIDWWITPHRIEFKIAGDAERELVLKVDRKKQVELTGTVYDKTGVNALPACSLTGITFLPADFSTWQMKTDEKGEFRVQRYEFDTTIHAITADKKLVGIQTARVHKPTVALKLDQAGTIRGRLLQPGTSEPWSGQKIGFAVIFQNLGDIKSRSSELPKLGSSTTTAADGTFELTGVVPGRENQLELEGPQGQTLQSLRVFQVVVGEDKDLGDITPPPAKPNPPAVKEPENKAPPAAPKPEVGKAEPAPAAANAAADNRAVRDRN